MAQKRGSLGFVCFFSPKGPLLLFSNTGCFTLHSDQSFPNIPSQLCSRIGIDPGKRENISAQVLFVFFCVHIITCLTYSPKIENK